MKKTTAYIIMVIVSFFWAGSFVAGKFSAPEVPAFSSSFLRLGLATVMLFPIVWFKTKGKMKIARSDLKTIIALGVIGMFGYQVLFFISVKYTTVIATSTINSMNPLFVTLILAFVLKDKINLKTGIALLISFFGVVMAITDGNFGILIDQALNIGNLFMAVAILCWSIYGVISQVSGINLRYEPITVTFYAFLIASILLLPFFIFEQPWVFMPEMTGNGWTAILYMAIFPSVIGYSLQQESIKAIGIQKTSIFINLVPIFSMGLSIIMLGDSFSIAKGIAILAVIVGVVLNNMEIKKGVFMRPKTTKVTKGVDCE